VIGPSAYGTLALALAVTGIGSSLVTVGGGAVLGRYVPAAPENERVALAHALVRRLALVASLPLVFAAGACAVLAAADPQRFSPGLVTVIAVALVMETAASLASQVALGVGRIGTWTSRYALQNLVLMAAALGLAHEGATGAAGAVAVSSAAGFCFVGARLRTARRGGAKPALPSGAVRFGVVSALSSALVLLTQRGAVLAAGAAAGTRQAGFAGIAVGVGLTLTFAAWWLFTSQLPELAARLRSRGAAVEREANRLAEILLAVYVPLTVSVSLGGRFLLQTLVGHRFGGAATALTPALATAVLAPPIGLVTQIAILRLRADVRFVAAAAGAVVFCITAAAAAPSFGAAGATLGLFTASVATLLVGAQLLRGALPTRLLVGSLAGAAVVLAAGWA
jgi:O-antigen/teichoic acid export membrane protein